MTEIRTDNKSSLQNLQNEPKANILGLIEALIFGFKVLAFLAKIFL